MLNYKFRFRQMNWREEFEIKFDPKRDRLRTILSHALDEVSGMKVKSADEAYRIFHEIPSAVIYRMFLIWRGGMPEPRLFRTIGLYKAPEPNNLVQKIQEAEEQREHIMDRVERELEAKFGRRELQEAREIERQMFRNSKGRGVTPATEEPQPEDFEVDPSAHIDQIRRQM